MRFPIWWYPVGICALSVAIVSPPGPWAGRIQPHATLAAAHHDADDAIGSLGAAPEGVGRALPPWTSSGTDCRRSAAGHAAASPLAACAAMTDRAVPARAPGGDCGDSGDDAGAGEMAASAMEDGVARIQGETRPRLRDFYQTEHFSIYYTRDPRSQSIPALDDTDKDSVPDYIEALGTYFEQARAVYTNAGEDGMGYAPPPSQNGARYPVYVYQLAQGYSGQTWPENRSGRRATSHISIDAHLYEPYVRFVVAHEFFHAVQFGYNVSANSWWKEASADWAAHEVFSDVDTYLIPYYDWFHVPGWSLDYADGWHEYAGSLWARHLEETRGRDFIRAIWENQRAENDSLTATAQALAARGVSLAAQFRDFAAWNWFTGDRADAAHYHEADQYPMLDPADRTAISQKPLSGSLPRLASVYLSLTPPDSGSVIDRGLTVRLKNEPGLDAQLVVAHKDGTSTIVPVNGPRVHVAGYEKGLDSAVLIVTNGDTRGSHSYAGTLSMGLVYRDQYGYVWDLEIDPAGVVRGTVDVGDRLPWPVTGTVNGSSFRWRVVNQHIDVGEPWSTGFDVAGSLPDRAAASIGRWSNDAGRADNWTGTGVNGLLPTVALASGRGPALK